MSRSRHIKERITASVIPFAIILLLGFVQFLNNATKTWSTIVGFAAMLVTTFALRQMSNYLQLIRIRSWGIATVFVLFVVLGANIHHWDATSMIVALLFLLHILGLLTSYQASHAQVNIFLSATALACISVIVPKMLWMVLACILSMVFTLRTYSLKSLSALLLGLLLPYEFWAGWHLMQDSLLDAARSHWLEISSTRWSDFVLHGRIEEMASINVVNIRHGAMLLLGLYGIISIVHFVRTSFNDKTRTRMSYFTLILQWPIMMLVLMEGESEVLWPAIAVCESPLLAHYFVFSRNWLSNVMFWLFFVLCCYLVSLQL